MSKAPKITIELTQEQLALVLEALDSHEYWQLSDELYRDDGFVRGKGSDDPAKQKAIRRVRALVRDLEPLCTKQLWDHY